MSYRSFKRVLGESSLERKCRFLFGISLLLLLGGAFLYAGWTAEKLVAQGPLLTGQFLAREKFLSYHYVNGWEVFDGYKNAARKLNDTIGQDNFEWDILVLDDRGVLEDRLEDLDELPSDGPVKLATGDEIKILEMLRDEVDRRFEEYGRDKLRESDTNEDPVETVAADTESPFQKPVSHLEPYKGDYHYYQPILWQPFCTAICHPSAVFKATLTDSVSRYAYPHSEWAQLTDANDRPKPDTLRVMRVIMPSQQTTNEMMRTRGILSAIAIATVTLCMMAFHFVIRYVIVKPLNHLREVSEEIGHGNYESRANIQTNDEFEELASSFNKMLRHLVDAQAELRNVNNDLDAKVDQLAQVNMQLHEMNRVKSDFLASMSHELRTPLNSIIGFADVLKETDSLNEKQKRYAANIGSSGRALLEIINDILDLAKAESGKMEVRLTEFDVDRVVDSQCDLVRSLSEEKNIDLTTDVQQDLPPLYQDQGKLQQILINLLSNAIKFTPEGGRISVSAVRDPMRHLVLTVEDTGVGIAEEERSVIFEKFRQGTRTVGTDHLTRQFSGSGLGLSIVKELCKLLGGEVYFDSELGKGSVFHVRVPWTLADQPKVDASIQQRLDEVTKSRPLEFSSSFTQINAELPSNSDDANDESVVN